MVIRQLKINLFEDFYQSLMEKGVTGPLEASYTVTMHIDGAKYEVRLQPHKRRKIAVLQALRVNREENETRYRLITDNSVLSALLELLVYQGIAGH